MASATRYKFHIVFLASALSLCQFGLAASTSGVNVKPFGEGVIATGHAKQTKTPNVSYVETYLDDPLANKIRATYWSTDKKNIAFKSLVFPAGSNIPSKYEIIDLRRARGYRVAVNSNIAEVQKLRIRSDGTQVITKQQKVEINDNTVIDAGFHRFIISNWEHLNSGAPMKIKYLQVEKARLVPLRIKKKSCKVPGTTCFKITFDNMLLKSMLPSIFLEYEIASKRLMRYTGLGPLPALDGKGMPVDIVYKYASDNLTSASQ